MCIKQNFGINELCDMKMLYIEKPSNNNNYWYWMSWFELRFMLTKKDLFVKISKNLECD